MSEIGVEIDRIGRYRITSELGRGGMGVVYRGEDPLIGRDVAIKTLTETTPELRERFYMEARSGILNHPNIVTVYELGEHEGAPFIAMEYVAGDSLEAILRERKRLVLLEALSIVEQICAGIGYAHSHGVVHRDIKPANVLIRSDGAVIIVDFGIARLADQTRHLTKTDAVLGTFHYIAPERLRGEASDGRADIWSTGVILYEMLAGGLPFQGGDVSSLFRVIHEPYLPIETYVPDAPEGLSHILDRALAKEVSARYATAEEMALDIQVIANTLKQDRLESLVGRARRLAEEHEYASARSVLLQAQRLDPTNGEIKELAQDLQGRLNRLQRTEQLRQIVEQAQSASEERRFDDAIAHWLQVRKLDTENIFHGDERLEELHARRAQRQQIEQLSQRASEARRHGDLTAAQEHLAQALALDEKNTEVRNAYALLVREAEERQRERQLADLLQSARESYAQARYTETIERLRQAAEIDPGHVDVQQLLFSATKRDQEARRQRVLERLIAEIQESLHREDFIQAAERVQRALQTLPTEGSLLQLKAQVEAEARRRTTQEVVRTTLLRAQELFADAPDQAMQVTREALQQAPDDQALLQLRARLETHLQEIEKASERVRALEEAHQHVAAGRPAEARRRLQEAKLAHGTSSEMEHLLEQLAEQEAAAKKRAEREALFAQAQELLGDRRWQAASEVAATLRSLGDYRADELLHRAEREQAVWDAQVIAQVEAIRSLSSRDRTAAQRALRELPPAIKADHRMRELAKESRGWKKESVLKPGLASGPVSHKAQSGRIWAGAGILILICVAVAGVIAYKHQSSPTTASAPASTAPRAVAVPMPPPADATIELNASPWGVVTSIRKADGASISLPPGDRTTPLRIGGLQPGSYTVAFTGPDQSSQTISCAVQTTSQVCSAQFGSVSPDQVLEGEQP
jgi:serine/threonine-protein kinase